MAQTPEIGRDHQRLALGLDRELVLAGLELGAHRVGHFTEQRRERQRLEGELHATGGDLLETIARNGRHLLDLINELLDLGEIEQLVDEVEQVTAVARDGLEEIAAGRMQLTLEPLALAALFREVADTVRAQLEARKHKLAIEPERQPLMVTADRGRLRQVLLNLLSNAIKFTTDGGRITLSAQLA